MVRGILPDVPSPRHQPQRDCDFDAWHGLADARDQIDRIVRVGTYTLFNELTVAEYTPQIELNSANGISALVRDRVVETNGGTVTAAGGEIRLRTGTTASGSAMLESSERGRYQPGVEGVPGLGIRRPTAPTGNQEWRAGYYDDNNGFFIGEDATGVFVRLRSGGTDRDKVYQTDWNVDTLDGNGESGLTLDLDKPIIVRFPFTWYFSGPCQVDIVAHEDSSGRPHLVPVHRFYAVDNAPILQQPNLPIRAEVDNGGDETSLDLYVGGRQFAIKGRYDPSRRVTSETVFSASLDGTTIVPVLSFRKKSAQEAKSVKVLGFSVLSADDLQMLLVLGGSLTGASYGSLTNIPAAETAVEVDTSATAISGGTAIYEGLALGGLFRPALSQGERLLIDLPDDSVISLCARRVSGAGGTVTATLRVEEEW